MWMNNRQVPEAETAQPAGTKPEETPPTPTPTITKLFHGKDTYTVSGGAAGKPEVQTVTIDPMDPAVSGTQKFEVVLSNSSEITNASLSVRTDSKTTTLPLKLANGSNVNGTWTASWTVPETYNYNYIVTVSVTGANGTTTVPVTIRQRP